MKTIETYLGVEITYNEDKDRFEARIDDLRVRYNEKLSALKDSIYKALNEEPKPKKQDKVEAYYLNHDRWSDETKIKNIVITSFGLRRPWSGADYRIEARVRGLSSYKQWEFSDDWDKFYAKTPENLKLITEYQKIEKEKREALKKYSDKLEKVLGKIKTITVPNKNDLPIWD